MNNLQELEKFKREQKARKVYVVICDDNMCEIREVEAVYERYEDAMNYILEQDVVNEPFEYSGKLYNYFFTAGKREGYSIEELKLNEPKYT